MKHETLRRLSVNRHVEIVKNNIERRSSDPAERHNVEISIDQPKIDFVQSTICRVEGLFVANPSWTFGLLHASGYPQYTAKGAPTIQISGYIDCFICREYSRIIPIKLK